MTEQQPTDAVGTDGQSVSEAEGVAGRARLADWLSRQDPEFPVSADELAAWSVERRAEFLVFVPPGYANQVFLVADHGISSFAPSQQRLDDVLAAARAQR
ncbi:hypothetical protein AB0L70_06420 [Kribbella sp. NPDC051952]|uniref:hypothetical protein n=1 Tax=Kribbella sp. NPDC051952 TaxID=3154851 RepID=UPI00342F9843